MINLHDKEAPVGRNLPAADLSHLFVLQNQNNNQLISTAE